MATYLLLRNNKESGPYSVDDLMELGLKAYDLVWIQGKSAAWRYPSEVDELKTFAPVIEEQPYDRFFKKPADTKKELSAVVEQTIKQEMPPVKPEHEKYIPKKSVYVAMPGQKSTIVSSIVPPPVKREETVAASVPVPPTITVSENPAAAQIKYSQPLDEIKEMYVKTLQDRKQKIARKSFWLQNLKKTAALLSLVAVGLVAGFVIKSNNGKQKEIGQKTEAAIQTLPLKSEPEVNSAVNNNVQDTNKTKTNTANNTTTLAASPEVVQPMRQPTGGYVNKLPERKDKRPELTRADDKPVSSTLKKDIAASYPENKTNSSEVIPGTEMKSATGERTRKVRDGSGISENNTTNLVTPEKRSFSSDGLSHFVSVKSNEYKKVAFGGIRDLQLTVTNDSKYILDNVTVELQYLKPSEQPLRTENIQFTSVGPKATSTIRVPDTNRGIKVVYRIINIKSRQMDEGVAGN